MDTQTASLLAHIHIQPDPIDPEAELRMFHNSLQDTGAVVSFSGIVREQSGQKRVTALTIQHYAGFSERHIAAIADRAQTRWPLRGLLIRHRYGTIEAGEVIVLVAVAAEHRRAAFEACDFLMDHLKTDAPFWKQEHRDSGPVWIEPSEQDKADRARWNKTDA